MLASVSKNRQLSLYFRWSYLLDNASKFSNIDSSKFISDFLTHNKDAIDPEKLRSKDFYYIPLFTQEVHSKLVFTVSVSQDCQFVATGSRDKRVRVFQVFKEEGQGFEVKEIWVHRMKHSVRAVEFLQNQKRVLAIGLDNGKVLLVDLKGGIFLLANLLEKKIFDNLGIDHGLAVTKLRSRSDGDEGYYLASASEDHLVRISRIKINE